jgi:hypothetical protein
MIQMRIRRDGMIQKRIMRYVLVASVILFGTWLVIGCADNTGSPMNQEADCDTAMLYGLIDEELASVDMEDVDTSYDEHLLSDPWTGARAECDSTAPDTTWREGPWIIKRELCRQIDCIFSDVTNFRTGYGVLKNGTMTLEPLQIQDVSETSQGWDVYVACGENDGSTSLYIPLRVYFDMDNGCLGDINEAVSGYIQVDSLSILIRIMDGVVSVGFVDINDLYVHSELFGTPTANDLLSDIISSVAGWMEGDSEEFFGLMVKERVEAAYDEFVAECP